MAFSNYDSMYIQYRRYIPYNYVYTVYTTVRGCIYGIGTSLLGDMMILRRFDALASFESFRLAIDVCVTSPLQEPAFNKPKYQNISGCYVPR